MIRIEHISFEFTAPDEQFAYGLHADWDGFCRRCFEQVVEECCAAHNKEKVLHEIERLEPVSYTHLQDFPRTGQARQSDYIVSCRALSPLISVLPFQSALKD